jgi:hypothetical protein
MRNAYDILIVNTERKRPFGRIRRRWADSIKMDLREIGLEVVDWMFLAQDSDHWWTLMNTVMKFRVL